MDHFKSIVFAGAIIAAAVVLSDRVVAGSIERGTGRGSTHARSWHTIDAGPDGVWAVSNEGALYFCRWNPDSGKPICSTPVYPD